MRIFDLHCDTILRMYRQKIGFDSDILHVSENKIGGYERFEQIMALYSINSFSDEDDYTHYCGMAELYKKLCRELKEKKSNFIPRLAVEGGKLLGGKLERIDKLKSDGVEYLTLVWAGECCVGGGHDTDKGLTEFGKKAVNRLFEVGIIPDVSHASDKMFYETAEIAAGYRKPFIASHSNSRTVCNHSRNLTDEMFGIVKASGGIVGVSLANIHLTHEPEKCTVRDFIAHIEHYMSLGGEKTVALGCDFDGVTPPSSDLPQDVRNAADLYKIADELGKINYSDPLIDAVFYSNAPSFFTSIEN